MDPAMLIHATTGALGAIVFGLVFAWIAGVILNKIVVNNLPGDLYFLEDLFRINPLTFLIQSHGIPFYLRGGFSVMDRTIDATLSVRMGLLIFLFIPFTALFMSANINTRNIAPKDFNTRLHLGLAQGVIYGLMLALLSKLLGGLVHMPLDNIAGLMGIDSLIGSLQGAAFAGSGVFFTRALFIAVFWGCLFSLAGALYASVKFNYSGIASSLNSSWVGSIKVACSVFKLNFIISAVLALIYIGIQFFGGYIPAGLSLNAFLFINIIPFIMLVIQGAPFQMGYRISEINEMYSFSLITGLNEPQGNEWYWFLLLILLVPVMLGLLGGYRIQKLNFMFTPWKNALGFSLCYTALFFAVLLVAQVTGNMNVNTIEAISELIPSKARFILGFPILWSLLCIGIISFITAFAGANFISHRFRAKEKQGMLI